MYKPSELHIFLPNGGVTGLVCLQIKIQQPPLLLCHMGNSLVQFTNKNVRRRQALGQISLYPAGR